MRGGGHDGISDCSAPYEDGGFANCPDRWTGTEETLRMCSRITSDCVKRLSDVCGRTEEEFLMVGSRLGDFRSRSIQVIESASSAAMFMSDESIAKAIDVLNDIIRDMESRIRRSESDMKHYTAAARNALRLSESLHAPLDELMRQAAAGRSDAPRSDGRGLAGSLEAMASMLDVFVGVIEKSLEEIARIEAGQQKKAVMVFEDTLRGLCALTERYGMSTVVARDIMQKSDETSRNISDVVTSIQYHDITHQQLMGVRNELNALRGKIDSGLAASHEGGEDLAAVYMYHVLSITAARDAFVAAVDGIIEGLKGISCGITDMIEETYRLAGDGQSREKTFFKDVEEVLSSAVAALEALSANEGALSDVYATSVVIRDMAEEIFGTAERVVSEVAATAPRPEGMDSNADALLASAAVLRREVGGRLASAGKPWQDLRVAVAGMCKRLDEMTSRMSGLDSMIRSMMRRLEDFGGELSADIRSITSGLSIHRTLAEVADGVISELKQVVAGMNGGGRVTGGAQGGDK